ncbi:MAG: mechanosensitive ion channel [Methyloprofundus sp.]|nr:mechanosensitive ion channel [Methyloprofundus sp.]
MIKHLSWHCWLIQSILVSFMLLTSAELLAEVNTSDSLKVDLSREGLQRKIASIKAKPDVAQDTKSKEINWYQLADDNISNQQWFEFLSTTYQDLIKAPIEILKKKASQEQTPVTVHQLDKQLSSKESKLLIISLKDELRRVSDKLTRFEFEQQQYAERPRQIRQETQAANKALVQARNDSNVVSAEVDNKYEYAANKVYLRSLINVTLAELKKLELEGASNPIQLQINRYSQSLLLKQQEHLKSLINQQAALLLSLEFEQAKRLQAELLKTERDSVSKHPVIHDIIQQNVQWSRDLQNTISSINNYEQKIDEVERFKKQVEANYKSAEKKIELAGLSPILGRVLREQRRSLSKHKQQYEQGVDSHEETGLIGLAQYALEERQQKLVDMPLAVHSALKKLLSESHRDLLSIDAGSAEQELRSLLHEQKELLEKLSNIYLKKLRFLGDYEFAKQQLLERVDLYESYLDERLLWVPSSSVVDLQYPALLYASILWFIAPEHWISLAQDLLAVMQKKVFISSFLVLFLSFLLYIKPYIKAKKCKIKENVGMPFKDSIYYTFQVLFFNLVLSLPVPLILFYISGLLSTLPFHAEFCHSIAAGLYAAATTLLILQFLLRLLGDQGVAELHFRWKKSTITLLRAQILWMQLVIIPCVFMIHITLAPHETEHADSLGRLAMIVFMGILLVFSVRLLKPKSGILNAYFLNNKHVCWGRLRYLWLILFISIPLEILVFSILGYYVSAIEFQQNLVLSMRIIFIAIILYSIIIRWLGLANRELALKNARIKAESEPLNTPLGGVLTVETPVVANEEMLDIPKINQQTGKIVNVLISALLLLGFWLIWRNILPAFSFIDDIVLWQQNVLVNGENVLQAVTLRNFFLACLYVFLISIVAINFSGVMEILFFRYFKTEAGSRYAVNQLAKYALITLGFISVANELGGSWAKVQWLVAALTVGLGFGLQEIFANMVSGIILLFERPIRVGDTVTVDNVTGRVTQIDMRATTIIDWDYKELIVPNKSFITNQLINWTLTDSVTRVVIPLGISYDADVARAHKVITETVNSLALVLKEPEANIYFLGFGDSSLDFSIRVYVSKFEHRLAVTHEIHSRLLEALRAAEIEIPFPQRDLHLR